MPAILAKDALEFKRKLAILDGKIEMVQLDIMDGQFVPHKTYAEPAALAGSKLGLELHLMVEDPETYIKGWSTLTPALSPLGRGRVVRVIVHAEIKKSLEFLIKKIKDHGWEAGLALNPETSWQEIDELIPELDTVLIMTVHPGKSGQPFEEAVPEHHLLSKISELHRAHPGLIISVDGGVNEKTLPFLIEAGARRFAVGSGIWNQPDPLTALQRLQKILNS